MHRYSSGSVLPVKGSLTPTYKNLSEINGNVPVVRLSNLSPAFAKHTALMKLESCNPTGSIKDKNASYLIDLAESKGHLVPGGTIIESSSGNFGIALAAIGASRGYKVVIVIDAKTSPTMKRMLNAYGAFLEEVPLSKADENGSMQKARMAHAKKLSLTIPNSFYPCQHLNPDNPSVHYFMTGREILESVDRMPDAVVVGISTCGQITGIARYIKKHSPKTEIIAVDVSGSVVLGTKAHPYKMTGLGLSFIPPNFKSDLIDKAYVVSDEIAFSVCHEMAKKEGLLLGGSTGAITAAAISYLNKSDSEKEILLINPDRGDRYLETIYNPEWLSKENIGIISGENLEAAIDAINPISRSFYEVDNV